VVVEVAAGVVGVVVAVVAAAAKDPWVVHPALTAHHQIFAVHRHNPSVRLLGPAAVVRNLSTPRQEVPAGLKVLAAVPHRPVGPE